MFVECHIWCNATVRISLVISLLSNAQISEYELQMEMGYWNDTIFIWTMGKAFIDTILYNVNVIITDTILELVYH